MQSIIFLALGIIGGGFASWFVTQRYIHRPKLVLRIDEAAYIAPSEIDHQLKMSIGDKPINNLLVLTLTLANNGSKDITVPDAHPPRPPNATLMPTLDFEGVQIIAIRTLNNDQSRFYVALNKAHDNTRLYVNIHRISAGTTCSFQLVSTHSGLQPIGDKTVSFFPGTIPDIKVVTKGLISRPWLKQQNK